MPLPKFSNALTRKHKAKVLRKRYDTDKGTKGPSSICYLPGGQELPPGEQETDWLGRRIDIFKTTLKDLRGGGY